MKTIIRMTTLLLTIPSLLLAQHKNVYQTIAHHLLPGVSSVAKDGHASDYDQYRTALRILEEHDATALPPRSTLSDTTIGDLNLLYYNPIKPDYTVLNTVKRTQTVLGTCRLAEMLLCPTDAIDVLLMRQSLIQFLVKYENIFTYLKEQIAILAPLEPLLLSLWNENDIIYGESMRDLFFGSIPLSTQQGSTWLNARNRSGELAELASPLIGAIFIKLVSILPKSNSSSASHATDATVKLPLLGEVQKHKIANALSLLGAGFGYAMSGKTIWEKSKVRRHLLKVLRQRFASLVALSKTVRAVGSKNPYHVECMQIPSIAALHRASGPEHRDVHSFFSRLTKSAFNQSANYFSSDIGMVLAALPRFINLRPKIQPLLYYLADIDALLSLATLYKEHQATPQVYSFANYITDGDQPTLYAESFWHPNLAPSIAVENSLFLGGGEKRNVILTGPNAAGKSTISKGIILTALLAQSLTIAPARTIHLTPFALINTYLNIVDDPESNISQHRAETRRTAELIRAITTLDRSRYSLTIMDEMLRITNPLTGAAAAFGIAKELGKVQNSILLLATHFNNLPRLSQELESSFENYRVTAEKQSNGSFKYPYKIEKGINNNIIALALLAHKGFNPAILAKAYDHLDYITREAEKMNHPSVVRMFHAMQQQMRTKQQEPSS